MPWDPDDRVVFLSHSHDPSGGYDARLWFEKIRGWVTDRQAQILDYALEGWTYREIAALDVSLGTVYNELHRIERRLDKIDTNNDNRLVRHCAVLTRFARECWLGSMRSLEGLVRYGWRRFSCRGACSLGELRRGVVRACLSPSRLFTTAEGS